MNLDRLSQYAPIFLALLRIVTALVFLEHGTQKLFDFPASGHPGMPGGLPPLFMVAGVIEVVGGLLLVLGLLTRYAAFITAGETAVIFWVFDVPRAHSLFPAINHGDDAVLFCFIFLYIFVAGAGAFSLDGLMAKRRG